MSFYKNCYRSLIRLSLKKFKKYDYKGYIKYKNEILKSNKIYYDNKSTDIIYEWNVINDVANTYGQQNIWLSIPYTFKFMVKHYPKGEDDKKHTIQAINMINLFDQRLGDAVIKKPNPFLKKNY
tara:strand:- start:507 stop:878 length:372 start_codon:yes stop_codon:yes gene_type:complete